MDDTQQPTEQPGEGPTRLAAMRAESGDTVAIVRGESLHELPTDLYIPPEALEVFLEAFEGPLDLLLYLIRRQNLDILDIQVAEITEQYMHYIELMSALQLELAGEYLLMAAMLAEIKSRMLLPKPESDAEDEEDPRTELIRRLREYERIKSAAESLGELPRMERDLFPVAAERPEIVKQHADPEVDLKELVVALAQVMRRAEMYAQHPVQLEPLSVRERMTDVLARVSASADEFIAFDRLFDASEGRRGVVVTFLALMELVVERLVDIVQSEQFAPIYLRAVRDTEEPV